MSENITEKQPEIVQETSEDKRLLSFPELIYQEKLLQAKNMEIAQKFYDWKASEDSKVFSKIGRWITSAWEIATLIAGLRDGECISVNNQGKMFKGYVNTEKLKELPQTVPQRIPSNFDVAEYSYQKMVSKSVAEPAVVSGFKPQWNSTVHKANKNNSVANSILFFFMENWKETMKKSPEKCHLEVVKKMGENRTVASIDGFLTKIVCNHYGNFVGFYYDGSYTKVW